MTSPDHDPLLDGLRAGPPEESSYVPPGLPPPSPAVAGRVTVRRLDHAPGRMSPLAALLGIAAILTVAAFGLMAGAAHLLQPPPTESAAPSSTTGKYNTPAPTTGGGWPAVLPATYADGPAVLAADGTFYAAGPGAVLALDARGDVAPGWPVDLSKNDQPIGLSLDPAGGIYVHTKQSLVRIAASGTVRDGWPVPVSPEAWDPVGDGRLVMMIEPGDAVSRIVVLRPDGSAPEGWPVDLPGDATGELAIAPDGGLLATVVRGGVPTLVSLPSDGSSGAGWTVPGWQHFVMEPSGDVVVWAYLDQNGQLASGAVSRTRLAILGRTGTPRTGWPVEIQGAMSAPSLEASGTIVAVVSGGGTPGRDELVAFGADGRPLGGWPVELAGTSLSSATTPNEPHVPARPIVAERLVLVAESGTTGSKIEAFTEDGQRAPGWPYELPAGESFVGAPGGVPGSPWLLPAPATAGGVFLASRGSTDVVIRYLDASGSTVHGWPQWVPDLRMTRWVPLEDGGLEVEFTSSVPQVTIIRFAPDGSVYHPG
jgi:hypothetical protein